MMIAEREITAFDQVKSDAFSEKLLGILNAGATALMVSVGHRTGLFDVMSRLPAANCEQIARKAGLMPRYVQEWLGAMVASEIVLYQPEDRLYLLPPEHAAWLTRAAIPNTMAGVSQWIPLLGQVEDKIVEAFRKGGGVGYDEFHRFHHVMAEESGQTTVWALLEHILPLAPGLTDRLRAGIEVIDVGCGSGRAICLLAKSFPQSRFTGIDLCQEAVDAATEQARELGLPNASFRAADVAGLNATARFDLITAFDAIHDQADPAGVLRMIRRALKPDGLFLMQDIAASSHVEKNIGTPLGPFIYTVSCMHCMTVSLAQGGAGLGAAWGEEKALEMLRDAGFAVTEVHRLPHDILNNYYLARPA